MAYKNHLFIDIKIGVILNGLFNFLIRLLYFALRHQDMRFLLLSPEFLSHQFILDTERSKVFRVLIQTPIDYVTTCQIYWHHDYDLGKLKRVEELKALYSRIVLSGRTPLIIDCGGNIGLATKYFSQNYPEARVLCIEPDFANMHLAKENNLGGKVDFYLGAIGSESGVGELTNVLDSNNAYQVARSPEGPITIYSINDLMELYSSETHSPFIVKIDIEGFEADLFSKNVDWVDKFPLLIVELHDWMMPKSNCSRNFLRVISALDRDFVQDGENIFSISNFPRQVGI